MKQYTSVKKDEKTSFLFARCYNLQKGTSINNVRPSLQFLSQLLILINDFQPYHPEFARHS